MTRARGTFVIAWSQTELDGLRAPPLSALGPGASWSWTGGAVCVDDTNDILVLRGPVGEADFRRRAAAAAHRLLRRAAVDLAAGTPDTDAAELDIDRGFSVTDGRQVWQVALIDTARAARPLLMLVGGMPPRGTELWVVDVPGAGAARATRPERHVICFTGGTRLLTPGGYVTVRALRPGDRLVTRDDGAQPIVWIGGRRLSGARLAASPDLRPIRLRAGAVGDGVPDEDLLVSPRHRILVSGRAARDLFNTPEVLVEARDLLNDRSIGVDHALRAVEYVHILLDRHQVVFANGIATESFHPAQADLDALGSDQRWRLEEAMPGLSARPAIYGATARRALSPPEAAILLRGSGGIH